MSERIGLPEKEMEKEGWIKQTTIGEPRLSEIVELYESLGYEVHIESAALDELDEECRRSYGNEIDACISHVFVVPEVAMVATTTLVITAATRITSRLFLCM